MAQVKKPPAIVRDAGDMNLIPGSERFPGVENENTLQCSCLENLMDRGAWQATAHEVSELETTVIFIFSFCGFRGLPRGR